MKFVLRRWKCVGTRRIIYIDKCLIPASGDIFFFAWVRSHQYRSPDLSVWKSDHWIDSILVTEICRFCKEYTHLSLFEHAHPCRQFSILYHTEIIPKLFHVCVRNARTRRKRRVEPPVRSRKIRGICRSTWKCVFVGHDFPHQVWHRGLCVLLGEVPRMHYEFSHSLAVCVHVQK